MSASGSSSHASERDAAAPHAPPAIGVRGLRMEFGALTALDGVDLEVGRGEVRGIIGENGAGKSTLMKVISGLYTPTAGQVLVDGRPVELRGPKDAMDRGIVMIHQELNLVDELTVADNIFLGREPRRMGLVDRARIEQESRRLMESFHCRIDPRTRVRELSIAQMQMVEIAKALACDARVLIMDEPTAVLTADETEVLFGLIQGLKARGVTTLYISHMLAEVLRICDRITVMRDGRVINTVAAAKSTDHELACMMVGRELSDMFPPMSRARDELVLDVQGLTLHDGAAADVSFQVRAGEIVGFAGLVGAGRTEVGEALVGLRRVAGGTIKLRGRPVRPRGPREASRLGIAYLSEDRRGRGLTTAMGIAENITMVSLREYCRPLIDRGAEERSTAVHAERLRIKMGAARAPVATLSGGNQQKVAIAKWLETSPEVLILDEPTRGVDVGAKREIYQLIAELAAQGKACIVISSELPEVLGLSHRIVVMREGRVAGVLDRADATEERVMYHAAGVAHAGAG